MNAFVCAQSKSHMRASCAVGRRGSCRGFTLVEIILVISIIALLLGIAIVNFDGVSVRGKTVKVRTDIAAFQTGLKSFLFDVGRYPDQDSGLGALRRPLAGAGGRSWAGPYMETMPLDPWGKPYQYRFPGERIPGVPDVFSLGPDGEAGTEDDIWAKDVSNDDAY